MSAHPPVLPASPAAIDKAAGLLRDGHLVAFATETVYGLGADAINDHAVAAVFAAKGRPTFNPLISHVPTVAAAERIGQFDDRARLLAERFWPGPLTLVLPRRPEGGVSLLATAGLDTVAVRVPGHPLATALLTAVGRPVAAPSANRSGTVSPTTARHVADAFGAELALVLDGGACAVGLESTVIDLSGPQAALLRPGGIPREDIEAVIGPLLYAGETAEAPRSPGQLLSHYAPGLPVRLDADAARPGEALLGFGPVQGAAMSLSPSGDLAEAAANLFAMLRALDCPEFTGIAISPIPESGLGLAINDRLRRAAAPRTLPGGRDAATSE